MKMKKDLTVTSNKKNNDNAFSNVMIEAFKAAKNTE